MDRNRHHISQKIAIALALVFASHLRAEIPPLDPKDRAEQADLIVIGTVKTVYSSEKQVRSGFVDTLYVIELAVEKTEKTKPDAADAKPLKLLYARTHRAKERPQGWAVPGGQYSIPKAGQRVTAYLKADDDGGYSLLLPNGIEPK